MSGEAVKISAILNCNSGGDRASCSVVCIRDTLKKRKINVTCLGNIPFPYSQMPHKHLESEKKHNLYCSLLIIMYCTVVSVVIQFYPWLKVYFQLIVLAKSLNTNKSQ